MKVATILKVVEELRNVFQEDLQEENIHVFTDQDIAGSSWVEYNHELDYGEDYFIMKGWNSYLCKGNSVIHYDKMINDKN